MKHKIIVGALKAITVTGAAAIMLGLASCANVLTPVNDTPQEPIINTESVGEGHSSASAEACYYGCPNSNKVKKLNIIKNKIARKVWYNESFR